MQNVHLSPPTIARLLKVNDSTIKRWVDRGLLRAEITPGGHRRISKTDLQKFLKSSKRFSGVSYVMARLKNKKDHFDADVIADHYFKALRNNDKGAYYIEEAFLFGLDPVDIIEQIISPTLLRIGAEWKTGQLSVFQEHEMSFWVRSHLFELDRLIPDPPDRAPTAVLANVTGEHHELPLHMLAIALKTLGWKCVVLGINISSFELARAVRQHRAKLIGLSKIYSKSGALDYLNAVVKIGRSTDARVIYGGNGWSRIIRERSWAGRRVQYCSSLSMLRDDISSPIKNK